jgi:hypothetical protein
MAINAISYLTGSTSYQTGMVKRGTMGANMAPLLTGNFRWWNKVDALSTQYLIYTDSYTTERTDQANSVPVCWSTPDLNDQSLVNLINTIPERVGDFAFTNINPALYWLQNTNKYFLLKNGYENIVTDGLVLNLDAGWYDSYPAAGSTWTDLSTSSYNATLYNNPTFGSTDGGYIDFDGSDDYGSLGNISALSFTGGVFTAEAWVYIPSTWTSGSQYPNLISKGASAGWDNAGWSLFVFRDWPNSGNYSWGCGIRQGGTALITPNYNVPSNTFLHIVATADGSNVRLYQNGVLVNTSSQTVVPETNIRDVLIGRDWQSEFFPGNLALTRLYNKALSATEVQQNYNAQKTRFGLTGTTISQTDLMFHVDANNPISYSGGGNMWYDISGNNYDFTLVNSPVYTTHNNAKTFNFSGSDDHAIRNGPIRYDVGTAATVFVVIASINDSDFGSCSRLVSFNNGSSVNLDYTDYFCLPSCPQNRFNLYYKVNPGPLDAGIAMKGPTDPYKILTFSWTAGSSAKQYTNGSLVASTNNVASAFDYLTVQRMTFAINAALTLENSYVRISEVFMYSRQMSDVEVTNTYNAIKSKYGL